jgi:hypothetical protein
MKKAFFLSLCVVGTSTFAASFNNRWLGLSAGYTSLNADQEPVSSIVPITLEGGFHIDSGFETYLRLSFNIAYSRFGVASDGGGGFVIGGGGQLGARYIFLEEDFRPWVGIHFSGLYFSRDAQIGAPFLFGPGINGGAEYFVGESVSLGGRVFSDFYIELNRPVRFAIGIAAYVSVYF